MSQDPTEQHFRAALDDLVEQVKVDRSVLAAILCGSLSHDRVWAKSDIDLLFVTIDDRKVERTGRSLYADHLNVHAGLIPRSTFRKIAEGAIRNSFLHSFLAKGRLLYTHDPSIAELFATLGALGERDTRLQLLNAATGALAPMYKARKWLVTRGDLEYTALYILYAAGSLAEVEVIAARELVDREAIPRALALNPALFKRIYTDMLNEPKTRASVQAALDAVESYLAEGATTWFAPVLEHLEDVGEARSATDLEDHFTRNFGIEGVTAACEYLADQGLVGKASIPVQLTRRSNLAVEELAFFHLGNDGGREGRRPR